MAKLVSYKAKWNLNSHTGALEVRIWAGNPGNIHSFSTVTLQPQSPQEMLLLVDLLRNESPIEYDATTKELRLGEWEVPGEGE